MKTTTGGAPAAGAPAPRWDYFSVVVESGSSDPTYTYWEEREHCGHRHQTLAAAEACRAKLTKWYCQHGRAQGTRCRACLGRAQANSTSARWYNARIHFQDGRRAEEVALPDMTEHAPGKRRFTIARNAAGGWRLRLFEDGEEAGGGAFPIGEAAEAIDIGEAWIGTPNTTEDEDACHNRAMDAEDAAMTPEERDRR
jgi:hypothetical protein